LFVIYLCFSRQYIQYIEINNVLESSGIDAKMFTAHCTVWYFDNCHWLRGKFIPQRSNSSG